MRANRLCFQSSFFPRRTKWPLALGKGSFKSLGWSVEGGMGSENETPKVWTTSDFFSANKINLWPYCLSEEEAVPDHWSKLFSGWSQVSSRLQPWPEWSVGTIRSADIPTFHSESTFRLEQPFRPAATASTPVNTRQTGLVISRQ